LTRSRSTAVITWVVSVQFAGSRVSGAGTVAEAPMQAVSAYRYQCRARYAWTYIAIIGVREREWPDDVGMRTTQ